jgi:hypothetical protein
MATGVLTGVFTALFHLGLSSGHPKQVSTPCLEAIDQIADLFQ